jgi:hypothetical protein
MGWHFSESLGVHTLGGGSSSTVRAWAVADWQNPAYSIDLVLVIDATGSMASLIESVKSRALSLHEDLAAHIKGADKAIDSLRVRVIAFRDFYADKDVEPLLASEFFELPGERDKFAQFVRDIRATGGGDEPETGLEGLATAIRSPWAAAGAEQRQVIVLWTDASAHPLEKNKGAKPTGYPADMPADMAALTELWDGPASHVHPAWKRLLLIAPSARPWTYLAENWDATAHYASKAGQGLRDTDYDSVLAAIAQEAQDSPRPAGKSQAAQPVASSHGDTRAEPASAPGRRSRGSRGRWRRTW